MSGLSTTDERILNAFLQLVSERGLTATTTRALAEAAGVNEVTIFRHFKDKEGLVQALFQRFDLAGRIRAYPSLEIVETAQNAADALSHVMIYLRNALRDHVAMLQFGIAEYRKFPSVQELGSEAPHAARHLLNEKLIQLRPYLRMGVDLEASTLSLLGLLLLTVLWNHNRLLALDDEQWDATFAAAIHPLIDWGERR